MTTRVMLSRQEAEDFLYQEARMLDDNQLYEWRDMMTDDVTYWVPVNEADVDPSKHLVTVHSVVWITTFKSGAQRVDDIDVRNYSTRQEHRLRQVEGRWMIAYKKVTLLNLNGHLNEMTHVI